MNILEKIVAHKRHEVEERKALYTRQLLQKSVHFGAPTLSLRQYLLRPDKSGVIAEIKKQSPSLGPIAPFLSIEQTSIGYMQAGASGLSILTDQTFFGGKNDDLTTARNFNLCPILRKDFIIDEFQIIEAKSIGADAILLIAAVLTPQQVLDFAKLASELGLEVLLELHDESELDHINPFVSLVGINNRNLKTFEVDIKHSLRLAEKISTEFTLVSESGISSADVMTELYSHGFRGFLIGEYFLKQPNPALAAERLIRQFTELKMQLTYAS